ncbi:hypothetical protein D3C84_894250 [compost metagenome]
MNGAEQRQYWLDTMIQISDPVLSALAGRELKSAMPVDFNRERSDYAYLEALGRTACGIVPWIELGGLTGELLFY